MIHKKDSQGETSSLLLERFAQDKANVKVRASTSLLLLLYGDDAVGQSREVAMEAKQETSLAPADAAENT